MRCNNLNAIYLTIAHIHNLNITKIHFESWIITFMVLKALLELHKWLLRQILNKDSMRPTCNIDILI